MSYSGTSMYWAEGSFYVQFGYMGTRLRAQPAGDGQARITVQRVVGRGVYADVSEPFFAPWSAGTGPEWR